MENRILCFAECRFPKFSSEGLTLRNTEASLIEHNRLLSTRNVSRIIMIHGWNHPIRKPPFSSIHSKGGNYVNEVQTKKISLLKNMQISVVTSYTRHSCLVSTRSSVSRQTAGLILKSWVRSEPSQRYLFSSPQCRIDLNRNLRPKTILMRGRIRQFFVENFLVTSESLSLSQNISITLL